MKRKISRVRLVLRGVARTLTHFAQYLLSAEARGKQIMFLYSPLFSLRKPLHALDSTWSHDTQQ